MRLSFQTTRTLRSFLVVSLTLNCLHLKMNGRGGQEIDSIPKLGEKNNENTMSKDSLSLHGNELAVSLDANPS